MSRFLTQIEIHPGAKIGWGVFIDHGGGVVIGETTVVGDDCTIYQGATLGGTGKEKGKRHPTLGKNVMIGSGAKVLGPFKLGDNSMVAAGAVVLEEVPKNATAVGVPAHVVKISGEKVLSAGKNLDQVSVPDPIEDDIINMSKRICVLEKQIRDLTVKRNLCKGEDENEDI